MSRKHTKAELGLLSVFATSLRAEYERASAEYEARKGLHTKAIEFLQRLPEELEEACGILLSLEPDREDAAETFKCMQRMLESQIGLIHSQLEHVEREVAGAVPTPPRDRNSSVAQQQQQQRRRLLVLPRPTPPPRVRQRPETSTWPAPDNTTIQPAGPGIQEPPPYGAPSNSQPRPPRGSFRKITRLPAPKPQEPTDWVVQGLLPPAAVTASRRTHKPWPTADPDFSRPALKPITFKMERDTLPRLPGDMSGAVHIRRQLDEQEEAVEEARVRRWLKDLGLDSDDEGDEGDDAGPRGQKRRAEDDDLDSPPSKRTKVGGLRGGKGDDVSAELRKLFSSLNPFKSRQPPGSRNGASANSRSKHNCFANDDSDDEGPRNVGSANNDRSVDASTNPPHEHPSEIPPRPVIVVENLRDEFGDETDDRKARRYRDWFASVIALAESTPGTITARGFMARYGQRKKLEKLKTALGHMSVRPFEKRQATQRKIKSLEGRMERGRLVLGELVRNRHAAGREGQKRREELKERCEAMGRVSTELDKQRSKLALQVALEEKIFVGGVEQGDCFLSWITKARNNVYWELSFADRTREKPERIRVNRQTYYAV